MKQNKGYNIHLLFNPNYCWSHSTGLKLAFICWNLLLSLHKKHPRMSIICRTHKWRPNTNARWMEKIEQTKKAICHNSCNLSKRNTEPIRHIFLYYMHTLQIWTNNWYPYCSKLKTTKGELKLQWCIYVLQWRNQKTLPSIRFVYWRGININLWNINYYLF